MVINFRRNYLKILFLSLFLLPIYPDNLKPTFIILFFIASCFYGLKKRVTKHSTPRLKNLLYVNISFFVVVSISLFYSNNLTFGLQYVFRILPLFIFPIAFFLIQNDKSIYTLKTVTTAKFLFYIATLLLFMVIFIFFYFKGYVTKNYFLNYSYRIIFQLGKYSMHPIYASLITSISLLFSISLFKFKKYRLLILFGNILLILNLILLSRKSAILTMSLLFFIYLMYHKNIVLKIKIISILIFSIISFSVIKYTPDISNRFNDFIYLFNSDDKVTSSNLRINLFKTSITVIKEAPIFGYGIGDVKDVLSSFESKNSFFKGKYYNTHNQFFGIAISTGIIGLLMFFVLLFKNFKCIFKNSFEQLSIFILFVLLMLIENIIDRQNGVIYFALFINYFSFYNEIHKIK